MKDKNGKYFSVGYKLQSAQSLNDAGIAECVSVSEDGKTCELQHTGRNENPFRISQNSLNDSFWEVTAA